MMLTLIIIICLLNLFLVINIKNISRFINLYDFPDNKLKTHKKKISLIGGTIVMLNIFFLLFIDFAFQIKFFDFFQSTTEIFSFLVVLFLFFILGFYDDKYKIKLLKFFEYFDFNILCFHQRKYYSR